MVTIFPSNPLGIKVEILLNSVWTDISSFLYQRNDIVIGGLGRADWTGTIQAANVTLTLDNRTGRFSLKNTAGAYFPFLTRNIQIRISVNSESTSLSVYNGFRFWGEVTTWPQDWNSTASDIFCDITASGIWRRISQNALPIGSAYRRYAVGQSPQAYWPMEDMSGSTFFQSAVGGSNATVSGGLKALNFASVTSFSGSDAIPGLNSSSVTANITGGTPTNNVIRVLLSVPSGGDSGAVPTANWNILHAATAGTLVSIDLFLMSNNTLRFIGTNAGGTQVVVSTTTLVVSGVPLVVSIELTPSGSSTNWQFNVIKPGAATTTESHSGTLASTSIGAISQIVLSRANQLQNTGIGHLSVFYASVPALVTAASAANGYSGEFAMDRFTRLCTEQGIGFETVGTSSSSAAMGPQIDDSFANLVQTIEDTDCGLLYEAIDKFGLGYRTKASMQNQTSAVNINYATAMIAGDLKPVYDDQLTRNSITVTDQVGNQATATLISGAMSTLSPPNGIGSGYAMQRTICSSGSSQVQTVASFLVGVGAVDEARYSLVTIDLRRPEVAALFSSFPGLRIGDFFQIQNLPSFHVLTTAKQLVWGYTETLNAFKWNIDFNAVPETPWETTFSPGTVQITTGIGSGGQSAGGLSVASLSSIISNSIQSNPILVSQLPQLTASLIGNIGVLNANPYFAGSDPGDWIGANGTFSVTNAPPAGNPYTYAGQFTITAAGVGANANESGGSKFPVTPLQQYMVTVWVYTPTTSAAVGFDWQDSTHTFISSSTQTFAVTANTWTQVTTVQAAPSNARFAYARISPADGVGNSIFIEACLVFPQVPGSLVQAGTITATQIAAGSIVAGIVNGTTIMGAQLISFGTTGQVLVYSGTPAFGNLSGVWSATLGSDSLGNSWSAGLNIRDNIFGTSCVLNGANIDFMEAIANPLVMHMSPQGMFLYNSSGGAAGNLQCSLAVTSGTDSFGNAYPTGVQVEQLTLLNQGSTPPTPASGSAVLFVNANNNIERMLASSRHAVLVDSSTSLGVFSVTGSVLTLITASWGVPAADLFVGTFYEVEAWGTGAQSSTAGPFRFSLAGFALATVVASLIPGSNTFTWEARGFICIDTAGSSGTARSGIKVTIQANGLAGASTVQNFATGFTVNTTISNNFAISAATNGTAGQSIVCDMSKFSRQGS